MPKVEEVPKRLKKFSALGVQGMQVLKRPFTYITLGLTLLLSCKDAASDLGSLENFAANSKDATRHNQCRASDAVSGDTFNRAVYAYDANSDRRNLLRILSDAERAQQKAERVHVAWDNIPAARQEALANELNITLTAVPRWAQDSFAELGGLIHVTDNPAAICGVAFSDATSPNFIDRRHADTIESCWVQASRGEQNTLQLIIKADAKAIQHNLVRGFGYLHAQFYSTMIANHGNAAVPFTRTLQPSVHYEPIKEELVQAFLRDKHSHAQLFDEGSLDYILGSGSGEIITRNLASSGDMLNGVSFDYAGSGSVTAEQMKLRKNRFKDYVFAEAFDSYYCNTFAAHDQNAIKAKGATLKDFQNTRMVMRDVFSQSHGIFQSKIHNMIATTSQEIANALRKNRGEAAVAHAEVNSGMNLTTANLGFLCQLLPVLCQNNSGSANSQNPLVANSQVLNQNAAANAGQVSNIRNQSGLFGNLFQAAQNCGAQGCVGCAPGSNCSFGGSAGGSCPPGGCGNYLVS